MGNSASSLPYAIGKQVSVVSDGWALHEGHRKSDNAPVTVFMAKKPSLVKTPVNARKSPHMTQLTTALHHYVHCKKLRHPHILQVYATLDTDNPNDTTMPPVGSAATATTTTTTTTGGSASTANQTGDLIIVTEPCISLEAWLQTNPPPEQIAWGLECVVKALSFLHTSANLLHGNVQPHAFYVTPAGDVKLWDFALVSTVENGRFSRYFMDWEGLVTPDPYRSPERISNQYDASAGLHVLDSYGMGVLIQHFYRHANGIPPPLLKAVQRLETPNVKMRPRLAPLLKCPVFDTPYQKIQLQLEEFQVQPVEQKVAFWQSLNLQLPNLPAPLALHKLLPLIQQTVQTICQNESMRTQDMYRREVLATVAPMFFIVERFVEEPKANKEIGPLMSILFTVNDRAVRGTLLQKISYLSRVLDNNALNNAVFEPSCSGFSDSSATLRELTLKACLELVPKLTQPNLEKLSRYLIRLQSDPEASIRTNTVIVFSKLAPHLTEPSRQKLLLPAYVRAMKDPFIPTRLSALKCTLHSKQFFDPQGIASRVLPAVMPQLLDPAKDVRREAFAVVDDFLFVLKQESERLAQLPEPSPASGVSGTAAATNKAAGSVGPAPPPSNQSSMPAAPVSGGYLSGLSSWMSSSSSATPATNTANKTPATQPPPNNSAGPPHANSSQQFVSTSNSFPPPTTDIGAIDLSDGWGDDIDDDLALSSRSAVKTEVSPAAKAKIVFGAAPQTANEEDFFGSFDIRPPRTVPSLNLPSKGKLAVPSSKSTGASAAKPVAPVVQKLATDDVEDGWDDF